MKKTNKILSILLVFAMMFAFTAQAFAAVPLPSISSGRPIICYTIKSSGKIYAYKAADLRTKTGGYIACSTDECKILKISGNAVQVKYPVPGGTRTAWFSRSEFTSYNISGGASRKWTQANKITTYRSTDGKNSFGRISSGDVCYRLTTKGNYTQCVYPVSGGYKMGWVKTSQIKDDKDDKPVTITSSSWQYPMTNAYVCGNNWGTYYSRRSSRPYHAGLDLASRTGDANVYAAADGKVAATGYNSANGYFVVIKHSLSGKTVYSFYAHLKKNSISVRKNSSIKKGSKIAVYGNTGSSSAGTHLHFAIVNALKSGGGYYGYISNSRGDRRTYSGVTYYNPHYVVKNSKLP